LGAAGPRSLGVRQRETLIELADDPNAEFTFGLERVLDGVGVLVDPRAAVYAAVMRTIAQLTWVRTNSRLGGAHIMPSQGSGPVISLMVAVPDARTAADWYKRAVGASELWNLGSVVGLEIEGAPFFLAEPAKNGGAHPTAIGTTTVRVEVFVDDPDAFVERAVEAGANGSRDQVRDHHMPWGKHRQGGFFDPFGHLWLVGDKSPLNRFPR
jgi:PhnB protein